MGLARYSSSSAERCLFAAASGPIYFSDIIFADILTSYAKVLGDVWLSLWMLLPGGSMLSIPSHEGWFQWILPSLMRCDSRALVL